MANTPTIRVNTEQVEKAPLAFSTLEKLVKRHSGPANLTLYSPHWILLLLWVFFGGGVGRRGEEESASKAIIPWRGKHPMLPPSVITHPGDKGTPRTPPLWAPHIIHPREEVHLVTSCPRLRASIPSDQMVCVHWGPRDGKGPRMEKASQPLFFQSGKPTDQQSCPRSRPLPHRSPTHSIKAQEVGPFLKPWAGFW